MPSLDVKSLRFMGMDEFRVLTAVEMGMNNHELGPTSLIGSISGSMHHSPALVQRL